MPVNMPGSHQINPVPNPGIAPNNQAAINQALLQRQYQMAVYSMTPEQRNHLSTLPPNQRKILMQRRIKQQRRMALLQRQYQMTVYSMTPEQRNHLSTLPPDQRKILMQRRIQQQRMIDIHRMQQQHHHQQQQRVAMMPSGASHMGGFRQPMAHGPHVGPMQANPPMPMQQVMQQQQRQMTAPGFPPGMPQMAPPPQQQQ